MGPLAVTIGMVMVTVGFYVVYTHRGMERQCTLQCCNRCRTLMVGMVEWPR